MHSIEDLPTPCLLLDPIRMQRNIDRLQAHLARLDVTLRPHLKTCKSLEIARLLMPPDLPVGALVRLLPNHACATAAQHDRYHLLSEDGKRITAVWPRFGGW